MDHFDQNAKKHHLLYHDDNLNRYFSDIPEPRVEGYRKELEFSKAMNEEQKKQFYCDIRAACESGWDFSSRWFRDGSTIQSIETSTIIPVDLNCLLYFLEKKLSELYFHQGDTSNGNLYQEFANKRKIVIHKYHFDENQGVYQDFNIEREEFTGQLTLAMVFPLFVKASDNESAKRVASYIEKNFLKDGGVVTSLKNSGQQWDYPNGWAPLQYTTVIGLLNYGEDKLAFEIINRWLAVNLSVFEREVKMMEKYNVVDLNGFGGGGEYPNQDGFGWTNGVALAFYDLIQKKRFKFELMACMFP